MKKQPFTMIELMVVLAIIMVLAGLSGAAVSGAVKRARITQAKSEVRSLATAVKSFESTYGIPPVFYGGSSRMLNPATYVPATVPTDATDAPADGVWNNLQDSRNKPKKSTPNSRSCDLMLQILAFRYFGDSADTTPDFTESHPLSTPAVKNQIDAINPKKMSFLDPSQSFSRKGFFDPWGNRYAFVWNLAMNRFGINFGNFRGLRGAVFVYSFGPNGIDEQGGGDDVASWAD